ncbi:MAG: hypothetical protein AAF393_05625, partial [Pseudomonadota bacterium]
GVDRSTPAGKELFQTFKKDFENKVRGDVAAQDTRVESTYAAVAALLKAPSDDPKKRAESLEREIDIEIGSWYNYSKNGLKREAQSVMAKTAKNLEKKYKSEIDAAKLSKIDGTLSDNRKDILKHVLGILAGVGKAMTPTGLLSGVASIVSNSMKLARKMKEMNDKLFKPTALNLARLAEMCVAARKDTSAISTHIKLIEKLRGVARTQVASTLAEAQRLQTDYAKAAKAAQKGDKQAAKDLAQASKQMGAAYKRASEIDLSITETDDIKALINQALVHLQKAEKLALERAKATRAMTDKAMKIANDTSIVADVVKAYT